MSKPVEPIGTFDRTQRGFGVVNFTDRNGIECSVQASSAIDFDDRGGIGLYHPGSSMLYIGPNDADPRIMARDAARLGLETTTDVGWIPFAVPDEVLMSTRMHLTRPQVRSLIKRLNIWLKTGSLSPEDDAARDESQA